MLSEVQIVQATGIPIFSYGYQTDSLDSLNQASFFSALSLFSKEINKGELKYVEFEKISYAFRRTKDLLFIFSYDKTANKDFERSIMMVSDNFIKRIEEKGLSFDNYNLLDFSEPLTEFNQSLIEHKLIFDNTYSTTSDKKRFQEFLFKSVGYTPGICNIGKRERQKRLILGMIAFLISTISLIIMMQLSIDPIYRLILVFPNILGFLGLYQSRMKFCVTNGLTHNYTME